MWAPGVEEGEEASARAEKFDSRKKLPKRLPHFPTTPVDHGPKGPTFITVVWEMSKEDIAEPTLPLPMEHQLQYGARRKGKWCVSFCGCRDCFSFVHSNPFSGVCF
jgi:hypothetical protein